jgi:hypothetical protein
MIDYNKYKNYEKKTTQVNSCNYELDALFYRASRAKITI